MNELVAIRGAARSWEGQRQPCALVTIVKVSGSSYRRPGAQMLVPAEGATVGTISGGCLEGDAIEIARRVLNSGIAESATWDLTSTTDDDWGLGGGCNGILEARIEPVTPAVLARMNDALRAVLVERRITRVSIPLGAETFVQTLEPPTQLYVAGEGADTSPLLAQAAALGWPGHLVRDANALETGPVPPGPSPSPTTDAFTAIVVMSHRFDFDRACLGIALRSGAFYVGVLGPAARTQRLLIELQGQTPHFSDGELARLHAPAGLDIGAESPEEIATSILSEIAAVRRGRGGGSLRDRHGPIHGGSDHLSPE